MGRGSGGVQAVRGLVDEGLPARVEILGETDEGIPTILKTSYAKGTAYLSFVGLDSGGRQELPIDWIRNVLPRPEVGCDQPLVERILRESDDGTRYVCLTNLTYQETYRCVFDLEGCYDQLVDLSIGDGVPLESHWDGTTTSFSRTLAPGEGTIIHLGKPRWPDSVPLQRRFESASPQVKQSDRVRQARVEVEKTAVDSIAATRANLLCGLAREYFARGVEDEAERILAMALGVARGTTGNIYPRKGPIHLQCPLLISAPSIDGKLDEWRGQRWERVLELRARTGEVPEPTDFDARFTVAWDKDYLYLAVRTADDMISTEGSRMARPPDSVGVHLNLLDDEGFPKRTGVADGLPLPGYGPDDFKFRFDMAARSRPELVEPLNPLDIRDLPGIKCAVEITETGYEMEIAIPWELVHLEPVAGYVIGFNFEASDEDAGKFQRQLTYRKSAWDVTTNWARMKLMGK